jgi:hypothetical protein
MSTYGRKVVTMGLLGKVDVVSKYIETQDVDHAKNASYRPRT